jgi:hypothetical protein
MACHYVRIGRCENIIGQKVIPRFRRGDIGQIFPPDFAPGRSGKIAAGRSVG